MKLTWYGHSAFKISIKGASILIDPFLTGNPSFPADMSVDLVSEGVTHVLLTHGHDDHVGDAAAICKKTGAQLTADYELCLWLQAQGVSNINPMNSGGFLDLGPFKVAMTTAHHSSSSQSKGNGEAIYLGQPHGLIVDAPNEPVVYHMGDTDIFGDMALINELFAPKVGIVPIGDRFTMGGKVAALACNRFFDFETIIPCHFGTFPILDQNADTFIGGLGERASRIQLLAPGDEATCN
ncbi:metal-dependent hydrolase [Roseibium algae]|uniref:UPF0173 metal-dependent hydrolase V6575_20430 n=1 Tax=Roseibium algae TaxID=3123038 RepID=A0ABU8TQM3_9HYPH